MVAGIEVARAVLELVDPHVTFEAGVADGTAVSVGTS